MAIHHHLLIFSLLLTLTLTTAEIRSDSRSIIPFDEFGFTHSGRLDLNLTLLSLRLKTTQSENANPNPNDLSLVGFFLSSRESWLHVIDQLTQNDIVCPLQSDLVLPVVSFDRVNNAGSTHFNISLPIPNPNLFTLVFANCIPHLHVSMDVHSALYNLEGPSLSIRDYLSAGKTNLPTIYFILDTTVEVWGWGMGVGVVVWRGWAGGLGLGSG